MPIILRESKMQRPDETSETSSMTETKTIRDGCIFCRPAI